MQWSRLKSQLDALRAPSLIGRLELHCTRYRHAHDDAGRAWITFDKTEVLEFSDLKFEREYYELAYDLRCNNDPHGKSHDELLSAYRQARGITDAKGNVARFDFAKAAMEYLTLHIDDALVSEHPVIRALAVIDRRVGKRRLAGLVVDSATEHLFVITLLSLRCKAEGILFPSETSERSSKLAAT